MHWQQGGMVVKEKCLWMHLKSFRVVSSLYWALAVPRWLPVWPLEVIGLTSACVRTCAYVVRRSDQCSGPVWLVKTKLVQLLCFVKRFACIHPGGVALVQGSLYVCRGSSLFISSFGLMVLCSLFELGFCLGCVESLPLPKGIETCLIQVILFFSFSLAFDCLLEFLLVGFFFSFSLWLPKCVCCQCTHQGGDWGPVWFENRWMVASWYDERLTMLCGLPLGLVL
jgi:hypothetical protein